MSESAYEYSDTDWGFLQSHGTGLALEIGMRSAACVWAAVCDHDIACLSRMPVAMGIAGMESNFNPNTHAHDGGYGLWQVTGL